MCLAFSSEAIETHSSIKLVKPRCSHNEVHTKQIIVLWNNVQAVLAPDETSERNGRLLRNREELRRSIKIFNIRCRNAPLHRRGPKENSFGSCGMVPEGSR